MNKKVSIIIPVYNAEKHLKYCLDSVLKQKYSNLEIILVDDGSTDNSLKICNEYAEKNSGIKVISKENGGVSSARNLGMKNSTGEYIAFIDSDDYVNQNFIEKLVELISREKIDVAVSGIIKVSNYDYINTSDNCEEYLLSRDESYDSMVKNPNFFGYNCNKLYKKKIITENNLLFNENIHICEDYEFNARYFKFVNKVMYCPEKLYYYYENSYSATNDCKYNTRQASVLLAYNSIIEIFKNINHPAYDMVIYNYIKNKLSINYRLHLIKQKPDFPIVSKEEKKVILKSKNLGVLKKIYIIISCKFPIMTSKIKVSIKKVIK